MLCIDAQPSTNYSVTASQELAIQHSIRPQGHSPTYKQQHVIQRLTLDLFLFFRPKVLSSTTWGRPAGSRVRPRANGHTGTHDDTYQHHFRAHLTLVLSAGLALAGAFFGGIPTGFGRSAVRAPRSHDGTGGRRLLDYRCKIVRGRPKQFCRHPGSRAPRRRACNLFRIGKGTRRDGQVGSLCCSRAACKS